MYTATKRPTLNTKDIRDIAATRRTLRKDHTYNYDKTTIEKRAHAQRSGRNVFRLR